MGDCLLMGQKLLMGRVGIAANSEDPDQVAPQGAVWSGSALFAHTNTFQDGAS